MPKETYSVNLEGSFVVDASRKALETLKGYGDLAVIITTHDYDGDEISVYRIERDNTAVRLIITGERNPRLQIMASNSDQTAVNSLINYFRRTYEPEAVEREKSLFNQEGSSSPSTEGDPTV